MAVINVRDPEFGALGIDCNDRVRPDGTIQGDDVAIQKALDAARDADRFPDGVVIYFPPGRYVVRDGPPVLPRTEPFRPVTLRGAGWMTSTILNCGEFRGQPGPSPLIRADPSDDPHDGLGYLFTDLTLGVGTNQQAFNWDVPIAGQREEVAFGRRLEAFFHRVVFRAGDPSGPMDPPTPLVFIRGGRRTRFLHCRFHGAGTNRNGGRPSGPGPYGVSVGLLNSGGTTFSDCITFGRGAFLDAKGSGEILISNCRSEGGQGRPAWSFVGYPDRPSRFITIVNAANEGLAENPSIFYFQWCNDVVLINPQIAAGKFVHEVDPSAGPGVKLPDGIRFVACENSRIIGGGSGRGPGFSELKVDQEDLDPAHRGLPVLPAHLIDVDAHSRYIRCEGLSTRADVPEADIRNAGKACCIELWGEKVGRAVRIGDCEPVPPAPAGPSPAFATLHFAERVGDPSRDGEPGFRFAGEATSVKEFVLDGHPAAAAYLLVSIYDTEDATHVVRINGRDQPGRLAPTGRRTWATRLFPFDGLELVEGTNTVQIARDSASSDSFLVSDVVVHY